MKGLLAGRSRLRHGRRMASTARRRLAAAPTVAGDSPRPMPVAGSGGCRLCLTDFGPERRPCHRDWPRRPAGLRPQALLCCSCSTGQRRCSLGGGWSVPRVFACSHDITADRTGHAADCARRAPGRAGSDQKADLKGEGAGGSKGRAARPRTGENSASVTGARGNASAAVMRLHEVPSCCRRPPASGSASDVGGEPTDPAPAPSLLPHPPRP